MKKVSDVKTTGGFLPLVILWLLGQINISPLHMHLLNE
jgi:hypothetical protein